MALLQESIVKATGGPRLCHGQVGGRRENSSDFLFGRKISRAFSTCPAKDALSEDRNLRPKRHDQASSTEPSPSLSVKLLV
jgi:hypothetical protein